MVGQRSYKNSLKCIHLHIGGLVLREKTFMELIRRSPLLSPNVSHFAKILVHFGYKFKLRIQHFLHFFKCFWRVNNYNWLPLKCPLSELSAKPLNSSVQWAISDYCAWAPNGWLKRSLQTADCFIHFYYFIFHDNSMWMKSTWMEPINHF